MEAVILIAGKGSRIAKYHKLPKCYLQINGETILERTIRLLKQEGINNIIAVTGYKEEMIRKDYPNLSFISNEEYASTNTLVSFLLGVGARQFKDDVLIINGDLVLEEDAIKKILTPKNCNVFAVRPVDPTEEEVKVTLENGYVSSIGKWVQSDLECIGLYRLSDKFVWEVIKSLGKLDTIRDKYYEDAFNLALTPKTMQVSVAHVDGVEIDTWEDYLEAKECFR